MQVAGRAPVSDGEGLAIGGPAVLARERFGGTVAPNVAEALSLARAKVGQSGLVVVTGSIYLVGAARAQLLSVPSDPPVDM